MDSSRIEYLLDRLIENKASEDEKKEYDLWYKHNQTYSSGLFNDESSVQAIKFRDSILESVNEGIDAHERKRASGRINRMVSGWTIAASLFAVIASAALYIYISEKGLKQNRTIFISDHGDPVHISNDTRAVKNFFLSDGSEVKLYPSGSISYDVNFGKTNRNILLNGKAFFQVVRDHSRPFTVTARSISTTALGTSFTIDARPGADNVDINLHTGKVVVRRESGGEVDEKNTIYMKADQRLTWNLSSGLTRLTMDLSKRPSIASAKPEKGSYGSRKGFVIRFDQDPLVQVLKKIKKGYSVDIVFDDASVGHMSYSGEIRASDSLAHVLDRIALLYDLQITLQKQKYIISIKH